MNRVILHSDCNSFYASVECLYNPKLKNFPMAVGGDEEARHGIILAKNDLAKKFGVSTGESIFQARQKCKNLVVVPPNYDRYIKISQYVKEIYSRYTDYSEAFGLDERWMNISHSAKSVNEGALIADEIRERVKSELGITVSIGVSFNKIFAKLGSDLRKPDYTNVISEENFKTVAWDLPASDLLYVGKATAEKLRKNYIYTIGDLAKTDKQYLKSFLGKVGLVLHSYANGLDDSPVKHVDETVFIKSIGNSSTTPRDLTNIEDIKMMFYLLSDSVASRLREYKLKCTGVQIYIRDNVMSSCTRQEKFDIPTFLSKDIAEKSLEIFLKKYNFFRPIRSIGTRAIGLVSEDKEYQLDLFMDLKEMNNLENFERTVDEIRGRFGYHSIKRGILLVDKNLTGADIKSEHTIHPVNYFNEEIKVGG